MNLIPEDIIKLIDDSINEMEHKKNTLWQNFCIGFNKTVHVD